MALTEDVHYILIKKAARFEGRRTLQYYGPLVVTPRKLIMNIYQELDALQKAFSSGSSEGEYKEETSITNALHNIKVSYGELKESTKEFKEERSKVKEIGQAYQILKQTAENASSVEELELIAEGMGEDLPGSIIIRSEDIESIDSGFFKLWYRGIRIITSEGKQYKIMCGKGKKIKQMLNH